jgi:hypothetical protein
MGAQGPCDNEHEGAQPPGDFMLTTIMTGDTVRLCAVCLAGLGVAMAQQLGVDTPVRIQDDATGMEHTGTLVDAAPAKRTRKKAPPKDTPEPVGESTVIMLPCQVRREGCQDLPTAWIGDPTDLDMEDTMQEKWICEHCYDVLDKEA